MQDRYANLDAIRGVAAVCVLIQHLAHMTWVENGRGSEWLRFIVLDGFQLGLFGVTLFFLISGFIIPRSFSGSSPLLEFAIKRAFRLYPAYWVSLLFLVIALVTINGYNINYRQVAANVTMVPTALGQKALSGTFWTLFIEMIFYVACVVLFVFGLLTSRGVIFGVGALCVVLTAIPWSINIAFGKLVPLQFLTFHLSFLFLGSLYGCAARTRQRSAWKLVGILVSLQLVVLLAISGAVNIGAAIEPYAIGTPFSIILAIVASLVVFMSTMRARRVPAGLFLTLGAWSYSIYLFHVPVSLVVRAVLPPVDIDSALLFNTVSVVCSLAISALVYERIEVPMIGFGRKLIRWLENRRVHSSTLR